MDELDINWISGNVQVELYDGDTIKITEADSKNLSEEFPGIHRSHRQPLRKKSIPIV